MVPAFPSIRRGRGRPSTRTKEERKIRRREVGRESQQRYRTRMKKKEDEDTLHVSELKEYISHWTEYHDLLTQKQLLTPTHNSMEQFKIGELFVLLLRRGSQPPLTSERRRQDTFARQTFTADAIIHSERFPRGPESMIQQNERYASIHPKLRCDLVGVKSLALHSNVIFVHMISYLPIKHRTIVTLFPHLTNNVKFMEAVLDKVIAVNCRFTFRFNMKNQIESITADVDTMQAWMDVAKDHELILLMLTGPTPIQRKMAALHTTEIQQATNQAAERSPSGSHQLYKTATVHPTTNRVNAPASNVPASNVPASRDILNPTTRTFSARAGAVLNSTRTRMSLSSILENPVMNVDLDTSSADSSLLTITESIGPMDTSSADSSLLTITESIGPIHTASGTSSGGISPSQSLENLSDLTIASENLLARPKSIPDHAVSRDTNVMPVRNRMSLNSILS